MWRNIEICFANFFTGRLLYETTYAREHSQYTRAREPVLRRVCIILSEVSDAVNTRKKRVLPEFDDTDLNNSDFTDCVICVIDFLNL